MKNKHRRLFGQNNRKAVHFFTISTKADLSLRLIVFFLLIVGNLNAYCLAQNEHGTDNKQLILAHINMQVADTFENTNPEDIVTDIRLPPDSTIEKPCKIPLKYEWRSHISPGQNTLKVSCTKPRWQVYVPAQVKLFKDVVVSQSALSRGNPIESFQVGVKKMDISQLRLGYFEDTATVIGYEVQRTVRPGQVITPYIAKAPPVINRGDWVTIISGNKNLTVTSSGEALKDGMIGDQILVRNLKSNSKLKAWILQKGVVSTQQH